MKPYYSDAGMTLYLGDVLDVLRELPDESVQCVVTSPPYWGLRDYGTPGQLGLEPTPEAYVAGMVAVFAEVRRVLRSDGVAWVNLGDSFWGGKGQNGSSKARATATERGYQQSGGTVQIATRPQDGKHPVIKPKDLVGIPWRVALALQADGWWLRSDIIWHKPNPMPESVRDRPTKSHEYLFLLTKSSRYYYDAAAIRESATMKPQNRYTNGRGDKDVGYADHRKAPGMTNPSGRNKRSVWTVATQPYAGAHFATFPPKLIEPCILAGTSEKGACPACGSPWVRVVDRVSKSRDELPTDHPHYRPGRYTRKASGNDEYANGGGQRISEVTTTGWQPSCTCDAGAPVPCVVLDPFMGSGTTALVAQKHGRKALGIDINAEYLDLAIKRNV